MALFRAHNPNYFKTNWEKQKRTALGYKNSLCTERRKVKES